MYSIYGDRLTGSSKPKGASRSSGGGSVATLKNILGTVRGANNPHCRRDRTISDSSADSEDVVDVPGSCRNLRYIILLNSSVPGILR